MHTSPANIAGLMTPTHDTMTPLTYFAVIGVVLYLLYITKDPMKGD